MAKDKHKTHNLSDAIKTYEYPAYLASTGEQVATKVRYEFSGGSKTFRYIGKDGNYGLPDGIEETDLELYGSREIGNSTLVVVVEGEKKVDSLQSVNIVAVSSLTKGLPCEKSLSVIKDKTIIHWSDNDPEGEVISGKLIDALWKVGATDQKVLKWYGAEAKADAVDAVNQNVNIQDLISSATRLDKPVQKHLACLLDGTRDLFKKYLHISHAQAVVLALWVAHTYVFLLFYCSPILHAFSPQKRCGKPDY